MVKVQSLKNRKNDRHRFVQKSHNKLPQKHIYNSSLTLINNVQFRIILIEEFSFSHFQFHFS